MRKNSQTHKTLRALEPLWARVGRANSDVMDLRDELGKLRAENTELKDRLMGYVRMRAPRGATFPGNQVTSPSAPVEAPPGYPARNKFKLLPAVQTRL